MAALLRRPSAVSCFFCQSRITPPPPDPRCFLCTHCGCWNRFDAQGEILSDEPAMHDETLNARSFARRASPRKDRFPTTFGNAPFCSVCQSNQRLLINLVSSYLPPPNDPDYAQRMASFDDYKASVYARYPPVCARCQPLVDEEINKKNLMARSNALGGFLVATKGRDVRRQFSLSLEERWKFDRDVRWWKLRGLLCLSTMAAVLVGNALGAAGLRLPVDLTRIQPYLPVLALVSILWSAWDPTYRALRKAQIQGRKVRVRGRDRYVKLQVIAWFSRTATAFLVSLPIWRPSLDFLALSSDPPSHTSRIYFAVSLCLELFIAVQSFVILRLYHPPSVRLIDTTARGRSETPMPSAESRADTPAFRPPPPDTLDQPSAPPRPYQGNPVFGRPSLLYEMTTAQTPDSPSMRSDDADMDDRSTEDASMDEDDDPDAMDWTPTNSPAKEARSRLNSNTRSNANARPKPNWGQQPQNQKNQNSVRFDEPTGLETLLERTALAEAPQRGGAMLRRSWWEGGWWWVIALLLVPLVGVAVKLWGNRSFDVMVVVRSTVPDE